MLERAAARRRPDELDEPEPGELANVVADVSERLAELVGELAGTARLPLEVGEDARPQRMRERLREARVRRLHVAPPWVMRPASACRPTHSMLTARSGIGELMRGAVESAPSPPEVRGASCSRIRRATRRTRAR